MKEAIVHPGPKVEIIDSPIPTAKAGQVVIKVQVSGSNPKDWKVPNWMPEAGNLNQGDDIAGIVHEVGDGVTEFKIGDRVAAFHEMLAPHGSYAEYAVAYAYTTFHIPNSLSFESAAAIPLAAMTACLGLFHASRLALPAPWSFQDTSKRRTALLVYGGASAVGSYVIQLANKAGIHPIIAIAGNGRDHVMRLLDASKGDAVVDYRQDGGDDAIIKAVREAVNKAGVDKLLYAFDAVSSEQTQKATMRMLDPGSRMTTVMPGRDLPAPEHIYARVTTVGDVHAAGDATEEDRDFGYVYFRYLARGLELGWFKPHNPQVVPGGLTGVEGALKDLMDGKASAVKYVFRIADTPGVSN